MLREGGDKRAEIAPISDGVAKGDHRRQNGPGLRCSYLDLRIDDDSKKFAEIKLDDIQRGDRADKRESAEYAWGNVVGVAGARGKPLATHCELGKLKPRKRFIQ